MRVRIMKAVTYIMGVIFALSVCLVDSTNNIYFIPLIVSGAWLCLIYLANKEYLENFFD